MTVLYDEVLRAIKEWRSQEYPGITSTTRRLLEYWFFEDHRFEDGTPFSFWGCQREAIEALIYIYEVCCYKSLYEISRGFNVRISFDPTEDNWPKYCFKMATGSGKTFVMAMAIVWQYFNRLREQKEDTTFDFLIVSPNLIVLDRLLEGFKNGGLYQKFPFFIPEEWRTDFDIQIIEQTSSAPIHSQGVIHITNRHQLYKSERREYVDQPVQRLLYQLGGPKPTLGEEFKERVELLDILSKHDKMVVINDEAHHAHLDTKWHEAIDELNEKGKILLQLDFTATAWDMTRNQQVPLPHIIYNYPLKRAIRDKIVKDPRIIHVEGAPLPTSEEFVRKHQVEIHTAKDYLERRKKDLKIVGKKPVLFVMCDNTNHANEVSDYFKNDLGYGDKVLLIHTYIRGSKFGGVGDIKIDQLEEARKAAREIDQNKYEIIVSVLMLTEGWDVRNVCVILPLRAFGSNILTEQTLGRGLRKLFPHDKEVDDDLYVIEHPSFISLWQERINKEDLPINIYFDKGGYRESHRVYVDEAKLGYNFQIPITKGGITSIVPNLAELDLSTLPSHIYSLDEIPVLDAKAIERRLLDMRIVGVRDLDFDFAPTPEEYFAYLTKSILRRSGSTSQFAQLYSKVRDYVLTYFFEEEITEIDDQIIGKMNSFQVRNKVFDVFIQALNKLGRLKKKHHIISEYEIKDTPPFHTTKDVYSARKTVFNCIPYDSPLEKEFMQYLDSRPEIKAYTKIFWRIPIHIPYYDEAKGIRYYLPDFVIKTEEKYFLVETKGVLLDQLLSVEKKAQVGTTWCQNVSEACEKDWEYIKIRQDIFEQNRGLHFSKLISLLSHA